MTNRIIKYKNIYLKARTLGSVLIFCCQFFTSNALAIEGDIEIKLKKISSGYILPRFKSSTGTYLGIHNDLDSVIQSTSVPAKPNVALGVSFNVESSMGKKLQVAMLLTKPKFGGGSLEKETYIELETIRNKGRISNWYRLRPEREAMAGVWEFKYFLVAVDDDLIDDLKDIKSLANAIPIFETQFTLSSE